PVVGLGRLGKADGGAHLEKFEPLERLQVVPCPGFESVRRWHETLGVFETETLKDFDKPGRVLFISPNKEIDVAGQPRKAVETDGMSADDQILNRARVQQLDKFADVLRETHRRARLVG
ncbi:MAG: hypothetical protein AAGF23_11235, partial [Acidobacteriota bacterium]